MAQATQTTNLIPHQHSTYAPQSSYATSVRSCCDAEINVPYSVDQPPCHVRIKQLVVCGGLLAFGIASIVMGIKILSWLDSSEDLFLPIIPIIFGLLIPGAGLAVCGGFSAAIVLLCPRYSGNSATCPCMPCVSAPCDTCHGVNTPPRAGNSA